MARAIVYCDRCGGLIAPSDIDAGKVLVGDDAAVCGGCLASIPDEERAALEARIVGAAAGAPAPARERRSSPVRTKPLRRGEGARRAQTPARTARATARRAPERAKARDTTRATARSPAASGAPASRTAVFIAASAAGVLLGIGATVVLVSGKGGGRPRPAKRAQAAPVTPAAPLTPVTSAVPAPAPAHAAPRPRPPAPDVASTVPDARPPRARPATVEKPGTSGTPPAARPDVAAGADGNDNDDDEPYDIRGQIASSMLEQAKAVLRTNPNDFHAYRAKLKYVVSNFGGTAAAETAARLIKEVPVPELPPERDPKPPGADAWARAVQVLPAVDTGRDRLNGNWRTDGGRLVSDKSMWAKIGLPYILPAEYDVRVTFERRENEDCLLVILGRRGRPFIFSVGSGNRHVSFETVSESMPDLYPTKTQISGVLSNGRRHVAEILVRKGSLRAYLDGRPVVGCQVDDGGLSLNPDLTVRQADQIGLATWNTVYVFHAIEVLPVTGEGRLTR